jgi:epoxyqueuosine reductase
MKGVGLAGAGIGVAGLGAAAAAGDTVFHDMDEALASPSAIYKKPWWVKLVDQPTVPIDWSVLQPGRTLLLPPKGHNPGPDKAVAYQTFIDYFQRLFPDWKPVGHSITGNDMYWGDIRMDAMATSHFTSGGIPTELVTALTKAGTYTSIVAKQQGWREQPSWKDRGYPSRWEGTPEENLRTMTVIARMAGADGIGAIEIDDNFKRLMWGRSAPAPGGTVNEWGDVDDFVFTPNDLKPTKITIPNKCKWFLTWTQKHPYFQGGQYSANAGRAGLTGEHAYTRVTLRDIQESMNSLGYLSLQWSASLIPSGAVGVLSGMGEQCRQGTPLQPTIGLASRVMWGFFTDMPLAPTKPIDFGAYNFCHTCGICAENCMFQSIPKGDPTWDGNDGREYPDRYNPGYKAWRNDTQKCNHCPVCQNVCPFTHNNGTSAGIHELVRTTISTTSAFNGFMANMDRNFSFNKLKNPNEIWNADIFPWGIDSSQS